MTSRAVALAAVVLVCTALGGCGGEPSEASAGASPGASPGSSPTTSSLRRATSGDGDLDGQADAGRAMTAGRFCGFLAREAPQVADLQPAEYAAARFGTALLAFYSDQGLLTDIDGTDMDALAARGCPGRASALLPVLGAGSFAELLSR